MINGVTALFLFNSAGLWTTLFGPRRGKYDKSLGNDMSLLGNIVVIGSVLTCISTPQMLRKVGPDLVSRRKLVDIAAGGVRDCGLHSVAARRQRDLSQSARTAVGGGGRQGVNSGGKKKKMTSQTDAIRDH